MGKPSARISDMHVCPKNNPGPKPHVGGPIAAGSANVLIDGLAAARMGDKAVCEGPPDTIASGSAGVLINGKPAARMGDSTAHGGKIVIGCATVLIGDGGGGGGGGSGGGQDATALGGTTDASLKSGTDIGSAPPMNPLAVSLSDAAKEGSPFTESPYCGVCNKK